MLVALYSSFLFFNHVNHIVGLLDLGFSKLKSMIPYKEFIVENIECLSPKAHVKVDNFVENGGRKIGRTNIFKFEFFVFWFFFFILVHLQILFFGFGPSMNFAFWSLSLCDSSSTLSNQRQMSRHPLFATYTFCNG